MSNLDYFLLEKEGENSKCDGILDLGKCMDDSDDNSQGVVVPSFTTSTTANVDNIIEVPSSTFSQDQSDIVKNPDDQILSFIETEETHPVKGINEDKDIGLSSCESSDSVLKDIIDGNDKVLRGDGLSQSSINTNSNDSHISTDNLNKEKSSVPDKPAHSTPRIIKLKRSKVFPVPSNDNSNQVSNNSSTINQIIDDFCNDDTIDMPSKDDNVKESVTKDLNLSVSLNPVTDINEVGNPSKNLEEMEDDKNKDISENDSQEVSDKDNIEDRIESGESESKMETEESEDRMETDEADENIETDELEDKIETKELEHEKVRKELEDNLETEGLEDKLEPEELGDKRETVELDDKIETEELGDKIETEELGDKTETEQLEDKTETEELEGKIEAEKLKDTVETEFEDEIEIEKSDDQDLREMIENEMETKQSEIHLEGEILDTENEMETKQSDIHLEGEILDTEMICEQEEVVETNAEDLNELGDSKNNDFELVDKNSEFELKEKESELRNNDSEFEENKAHFELKQSELEEMEVEPERKEAQLEGKQAELEGKEALLEEMFKLDKNDQITEVEEKEHTSVNKNLSAESETIKLEIHKKEENIKVVKDSEKKVIRVISGKNDGDIKMKDSTKVLEKVNSIQNQNMNLDLDKLLEDEINNEVKQQMKQSKLGMEDEEEDDEDEELEEELEEELDEELEEELEEEEEEEEDDEDIDEDEDFDEFFLEMEKHKNLQLSKNAKTPMYIQGISKGSDKISKDLQSKKKVFRETAVKPKEQLEKKDLHKSDDKKGGKSLNGLDTFKDKQSSFVLSKGINNASPIKKVIDHSKPVQRQTTEKELDKTLNRTDKSSSLDDSKIVCAEKEIFEASKPTKIRVEKVTVVRTADPKTTTAKSGKSQTVSKDQMHNDPYIDFDEESIENITKTIKSFDAEENIDKKEKSASANKKSDTSPSKRVIMVKTGSNVERVKRKLEEILEKSKEEEDAAIAELQRMKREKTDILNAITKEMEKLKSMLVKDRNG